MPQQDRAEYFYNQFKLHLVFGIMSLGLIGILLGMIYSDWNREWKQYQAEFRQLEIEKTRQELEKARTAAQDEVARIEEELAEATAELDERREEYQQAVTRVEEAENDLAVKKVRYQIQKSFADEAKYKYQEIENHPKGLSGAAYAEALEEARRKYERANAEAERLRSIYNEAEQELAEARAAANAYTERIDGLEKELTLATATVGRLERQLTQIRQNLFNDAFRNMPLVDFMAPSYTIKQQIIEEIRDDLHFTEVRKIDRCQTCHVSIDRPGYEDAPQPYTTHPDLELYVSDQSPHPMKQIGCTVCHEGNGMATTFERAAHTPRDLDQQEEWEEKYHWHKLHHWDWPMLPKGMEQTSCNKCHTQQEQTPEAHILLKGHSLFMQRGCYACHSINKPAYENQRKPGPTLKKITAKLTPEWVVRWVANPWSFRPDTTMPRLFYLENGRDPLSIAQDDVMVEAITRYLFENSEDTAFDPPPLKGDPEKGRDLVKQVGCMACHVVDDIKAEVEPNTENYHESNFGPNLSKVGTKVNRAWLFDWLKNPHAYWNESVMPSLRLTDEEAAHITAYLMTLRDDDYLKKPRPPLKDEVIDGLIEMNLATKMPLDDIREQLAEMTRHEKLLSLGEKAIRQKQCYSCHEIRGFETENPIILTFSEQGEKDLDRLDWGFISLHPTEEMIETAREKGEPLNSYHHYPHSIADSTIEVPYSSREELTGGATLRFPERYGNSWVPYPTDPDNEDVSHHDLFVPKYRYAYYFNQIKNPQVWDRGKVKNWWEKQRMGQFALADDEAHALAMFISAQRSVHIDAHLVDAMDEADQALVDGRTTIKNFNCQACHTLGLYPDALKIEPVDPDDIFAGGEAELSLNATRLWTAKPILGRVELWDEAGERVIGLDVRQVLDKHRWLIGDVYDAEFDEFVGVADYLMSFDVREVDVFGRNEGWIRQFYESTPYAPPVLYEQGRKTKPDWLFQWLQNVHSIRPHIKVRMPQYNFTEEQVTHVAHFFAAQDGEPWPFTEEPRLGKEADLVALGENVYFDLVKCNQCHPAGDSMPTNTDQSAWAPNLALAQDRLKADWLKRWLRNPQAIYPGTLMPNNFYLDQGSELQPLLGPAEQMESYISAITHWAHSLDPHKLSTDYPSLFRKDWETQAETPTEEPAPGIVDAPEVSGREEATGTGAAALTTGFAP